MKKFNATKMMALLMALCLITSTFVGSTLAKYTTKADAADSARVAKFGVEVTATANAFADQYDTDNTAVAATIAQSVIGTDADADGEVDKVVAPGTEGTLATTTINGTPEVAVNVKKEATLTLTGWTVDGEDYCPIVFKVNDAEIKMDDTNNTVAKLIAAVEAAIECDKNYAPNTDLANTDNVTVTWEWPFYVSDANDAKDTVLGNVAVTGNAATIDFSLTTTVTQID